MVSPNTGNPGGFRQTNPGLASVTIKADTNRDGLTTKQELLALRQSGQANIADTININRLLTNFEQIDSASLTNSELARQVNQNGITDGLTTTDLSRSPLTSKPFNATLPAVQTAGEPLDSPQAIIQNQLSKLEPESPEAQYLQARLAFLNQQPGATPFNATLPAVQTAGEPLDSPQAIIQNQLSKLEPESPEAQYLQARLAFLNQQPTNSTPAAPVNYNSTASINGRLQQIAGNDPNLQKLLTVEPESPEAAQLQAQIGRDSAIAPAGKQKDIQEFFVLNAIRSLDNTRGALATTAVNLTPGSAEAASYQNRQVAINTVRQNLIQAHKNVQQGLPPETNNPIGQPPRI